jgi:hypothetical protein
MTREPAAIAYDRATLPVISILAPRREALRLSPEGVCI